MKQFAHPKKNSIKSLFVRFAVLLLLISILATTLLTYLVNQSILTDKIAKNKEMLMNISAETTNVALSNIAKAINAIENEPLLYELADTATEGYERDKKINGLNRRINQIIMSNENIDTAIVTYDEFQIFSSNSIYNYDTLKKIWNPALLKKTMEADKSAEKRFYLMEIERQDISQRIGVMSPCGRSKTEKSSIFITIILSPSFEKKLSFINGNLYLNQGDTRVSVGGNNNETESGEEKFKLSKDLIFDGWRLVCEYTTSWQLLYYEYFVLIGAFFLLYLLLILWVLRQKNKKMFTQIDVLTKQIANIKKETISSGIPENKSFINLQKQSMTYSKSILLSYAMIAVIPIIVIATSSYTYTQSIIKNDVGNMIDQNMEIVSKQIDILFKDFLDTGKAMALSGSIQKYLDMPSWGGQKELDLAEIFEIQQRKNVDILNLSVFDRSFKFRYSSMYTPDHLNSQQVRTKLAEVKASGNQILWEYKPVNHFNNGLYRVYFPIIGIYSDSAFYGRNLGYLILDFNGNKIDQAIKSVTDRYKASVWIKDKNQLIIEEKHNNSEVAISASEELMMGKQDNVILENTLSSVNWTLLTAVSNREYSSEKNIFIYVTIIIGTSMVLLCVAFSYVMSRILSYNINKICHVVENVQFGDLDARFSSKRNDEIYALGENVNQMLLRIHNLIKEKYVIELKAKEFELNLLQSQINPHFLCNTLRTIEYMASVSDPRTVNTIKKLIYIFRRCLDVKNNLISLEEELKYVKNYTEIQQIRFGDKFCVEVDMPKELEEIRILQFTIQPLVENAIYHGVELLEANGKILILVEKDNTHIVVRVTDNGPGMNAEKLQEVRDRLAGKIPSESVGLINVNDRLKLQYGNSCGIIIESTVGIGTSVTLIMNEE